MKRISFLIAALLLMGSMVMAQGQCRGNANSKVRAEKMTERMAKEYSLDDAQKKKLLNANTVLMETAGNRPEGMRHEMKQGKRAKACQASDSCCRRKDTCKNPKVRKENREQMKASRATYDTQLKQIMTKDQYAAYTQKQAERQQKMKEKRNK